MTKFKQKLPNYWTLLALGTLVLPVSSYFCVALYVGAGLVSAISFNYDFLTPKHFRVGGGFIILSIWMISRTSYSWQSLINSIINPDLYPGTLVSYLLFFVFFWFITLQPLSYFWIQKISWSIALTSFPIFIFACVEKYLASNDFVLPNVFRFFSINKIHFLLENNQRLSSVFINPNLLGFYCVLALSVSIGLYLNEFSLKKLSSYSFKTSRRFYNWLKFLRAFILIVCMFLLLISLAWSGSRNAFLMLLFILIVFTAYTQSKFIRIFTIILSLLSYLAVYQFEFISNLFKSMISHTIWERMHYISDQSIRIEFYQCSLKLIQENPFMGWGIGKMAKECEARMNLPTYGMNHAHSIFLQLASEIGIPFTFFLSCVMAYILFLSISDLKKRRQREGYYLVLGFILAAISGIIMSCFALAMLHSYRLMLLFCLCLAIPYAETTKSINVRN